MPLKSGKSKKTVSKNIREFHKGNTYKKTEAAAMAKKRKSKK